jgi:hypothetical protein
MEIPKSDITDETGEIKSVVIDFRTFKKIEELILDYALGKAMDEVAGDVEYDLEEAEPSITPGSSFPRHLRNGKLQWGIRPRPHSFWVPSCWQRTP